MNHFSWRRFIYEYSVEDACCLCHTFVVKSLRCLEKFLPQTLTVPSPQTFPNLTEWSVDHPPLSQDLGVSQNEGRKSYHSRWKLAVLAPKFLETRNFSLKILSSECRSERPKNTWALGPKKKHPPQEKGDETEKKTTHTFHEILFLFFFGILIMDCYIIPT